jgi:hypothetical protein
MSERLEDIKLELSQRPHLRKHQIEWLIEQAEKVEQQQKEIERLEGLLIELSEYYSPEI